MPDRRPLSLRDLRKRLRGFGVAEFSSRCRNHTCFARPDASGHPASPYYTVKDHGDQTVLSVPVIKACLRVLGIDEETFW